MWHGMMNGIVLSFSLSFSDSLDVFFLPLSLVSPPPPVLIQCGDKVSMLEVWKWARKIRFSVIIRHVVVVSYHGYTNMEKGASGRMMDEITDYIESNSIINVNMAP